MWTHSAHTETWVSVSNQQISCDKKSFEFRINTFELSSDVVEVKLGRKKAKIQALTQQFCFKNRENPVRKLCTTCKESSLIDKPNAHSFFWWTSCKSRSSWFLLASKNFSTGPDKLFSMQTLPSQPRSSGWLSQPWGHWQWQQLATAADSWIFIDSRTQTRAECKHPVHASMHF